MEGKKVFSIIYNQLKKYICVESKEIIDILQQGNEIFYI